MWLGLKFFKLIGRGPRFISFWGLRPSLDPQRGALSLDPTGDFRLPDHDSTQAR